jgi:hypothetical protein
MVEPVEKHLSILGQSFWATGVHMWLYLLYEDDPDASFKHQLGVSRLMSKRFQATVAESIGISVTSKNQEVIEEWLVRALSEKIGQKAIEESAQAAIDWVISLLTTIVKGQILTYVTDIDGENIPGEWEFEVGKQGKKQIWIARKAQAEGRGKSKLIAMDRAIANYFLTHRGF